MSEADDVQLATDVARDARSFLQTLELVAAGGAGTQAVALLLLDVAQMCVAGAQLGARTDVILDSNVEPVVGRAPDLDAVRQGLAAQLDPVDGAQVPFIARPASQQGRQWTAATTSLTWLLWMTESARHPTGYTPSGTSSTAASRRTWATMLCSARRAAPAEPPQLLR